MGIHHSGANAQTSREQGRESVAHQSPQSNLRVCLFKTQTQFDHNSPTGHAVLSDPQHSVKHLHPYNMPPSMHKCIGVVGIAPKILPRLSKAILWVVQVGIFNVIILICLSMISCFKSFMHKSPN